MSAHTDSLGAGIDLNDIQGLLRFGFKHHTEAVFLLLRVKDAAAGEIRAAEAKANREQGGLKSGATPVPFSQIYGGETVTGTLTQVDCHNGQRRLTIR